MLETRVGEEGREGGSAALRSLAVMEFVANSERSVSLTEIMQALRLPKATVFRILNMLEEAGILLREPNAKRYLPGERLTTLAGNVLLNSPWRSARLAILEELVEKIGETCNLAIPNGHHVMYLERVEADWPLRINFHAGSKIPLYASASGKIFLAHATKRARDRLLTAAPLVAQTRNTITSVTALEAEFARIRRQGFAVDNEEYLPGIFCLAVPIANDQGKVVAAVAAHGPTSRMNLANVEEFLPALREAAEQIAQTLDW
ncbi:MAG: IclR family transcriptional regulator [Casimicrobiaceae bacterium]|nr:IclR family transcriptional regulator [Casimicrobiaceae bacterium]MCX8098651.1 IclR family transcriptional regulator [Casimicrobiaceae bacterium]MDW8311912.1 IclR family transcriptional regulator [Burkholderiales bacterium]